MLNFLKTNKASAVQSKKNFSYRFHTGLLTALLLTSGCAGIHLPQLPTQPGASPSASTPANESGDIKKWMAAGNKAAQSKQWASATQHFNQVIAKDANYATAHVQLGWVYAEQKLWDQAKPHLQKAIQLSPGDAGAHANLAWVHAAQDQWNDAQTEARKAIDLDAKNPYAHATLAWAYQKTNQNDLAISEYEKSLELKPDLTNSHFAVGMAYCNAGQAERAKTQLSWLQAHHAGEANELQTRVSKGCYPPKK
jgi:tetratricopeptide (TPR) repeat protein